MDLLVPQSFNEASIFAQARYFAVQTKEDGERPTLPPATGPAGSCPSIAVTTNSHPSELKRKSPKTTSPGWNLRIFYYPSSHCPTAAPVTMPKLLRSLSGLSHRLMLTARMYRACCLILASVTCALEMSSRLQVNSGRSFNENVVSRRFRDFSKRPLLCSPAVIRNSYIPSAAWTVSRSSCGVQQPRMRPH